MRFLLHRESPWIPVVLITILVGCWSELDLYAPSFPQMMHYFGTTEQAMQWTLSFNFLGFFIASLLCGPLADAYGRRVVILGGSFLFLLGSLICVAANNIEMMFLGRLVQGIGVSAPVTVCMAVIADIYQGDRQVRLLSRMNSAVTITMALAPIVGVYLTDHFGWRSNFQAIFGIALIGSILIWMFVPETHVQGRTQFSSRGLLKSYATLLRSQSFMTAVLGLCLSITPYFIFIGIIPLLFMEELGVTLNDYVYYQGSVVALFATLSLLIPFFMKSGNLNKMIKWSIYLSFGALGASFITSLFVRDNPLVITTFMWLFTIGITLPPTLMFAQAMDLHPELRACASSLIQSIRMLFMALGSAMAGALYNGTYLPAIGVMFFFVAASIPFSLWVVNKRGAKDSNTELMVAAMH